MSHFLPRKMDLEALIGVLMEEHRAMAGGLARVRESARLHDFEGASNALKELEPVFRQHIVDEESQILRLLIEELGMAKAEEEIRVFQQHRPIHRLMQMVSELAGKSAPELQAEQSKLDALFAEHTLAEETRVFPRALGSLKRRAERSSGE